MTKPPPVHLLTAEQARAKANDFANSEQVLTLLNSVLKTVMNAATEGRYTASIGCLYASKVGEVVQKRLEDLGYEISHQSDQREQTRTTTVSWLKPKENQ